MENKILSSEGSLCCHDALIPVIDGIFDTRFGLNKNYSARKCKKCDLVQTYPVPYFDEIKMFYELYYNFGNVNDTLYTRLRENFMVSLFYRLWLSIDGDIAFHLKKGSGRLLDIGCNEGRGLLIYKKNGYEAHGLELNHRAADNARKKGFKVYTDLLEKFEPKQPYQYIVLSNVLEHSLDPSGMLYHVKRLLEPEGEVWISCPNFNSWQRKLFKKYWINWHVPFHIFHFSQITLKNILESEGFKIVDVQYKSPAIWITQSFIARIFGKVGRPTRQLRNPLLVAIILVIVKLLLFPLLLIGNYWGRGDCIVFIAKKSKE